MPPSPRLGFSVPPSLYAAAERRAAKEGIPLARLCLIALAKHLKAPVPDMPMGLAGADAETVSRVTAEGGVAAGRVKRSRKKS